jgi:glycerol kinase
VSYMNEEDVWCSLTRSRKTDLGSRFCLVCVGLEGPAWDDDARETTVGSRGVARRAIVVAVVDLIVYVM